MSKIITEEFFLLFIQLDRDFLPGEFGHDLTKMVEALGFQESNFTKDQWEFLLSSEWVYKIARYPFTDLTNHASPLKKLAHEAIGISAVGRKYGMVNSLEEGFTSASSKAQNIKRIHDSYEKELLTLISVLQKITRRVK